MKCKRTRKDAGNFANSISREYIADISPTDASRRHFVARIDKSPKNLNKAKVPIRIFFHRSATKHLQQFTYSYVVHLNRLYIVFALNSAPLSAQLAQSIFLSLVSCICLIMRLIRPLGMIAIYISPQRSLLTLSHVCATSRCAQHPDLL
jgi:hypothetical protein